MIPEQTIEALRMGFGHLGSASSDLKCAHIDTLSTSLEKDKDTITCFVLSSLSEKVLENFKSTNWLIWANELNAAIDKRMVKDLTNNFIV